MDFSRINILLLMLAALVAGCKPTADNQQLEFGQDSADSITLTANKGVTQNLTFAVTKSPSYGSITSNGANVVYTPFQNYVGNDAFEFTATNASGETSKPGVVALSISERFIALRPMTPKFVEIKSEYPGQVMLKWTPSYDDNTAISSMKYNIHVTDNENEFANERNLVTSVTGDNQVTINDLQNEKEYFFTLVAQDASGKVNRQFHRARFTVHQSHIELQPGARLLNWGQDDVAADSTTVSAAGTQIARDNVKPDDFIFLAINGEKQYVKVKALLNASSFTYKSAEVTQLFKSIDLNAYIGSVDLAKSVDDYINDAYLGTAVTRAANANSLVQAVAAAATPAPPSSSSIFEEMRQGKYSELFNIDDKSCASEFDIVGDNKTAGKISAEFKCSIYMSTYVLWTSLPSTVSDIMTISSPDELRFSASAEVTITPKLSGNASISFESEVPTAPPLKLPAKTFLIGEVPVEFKPEIEYLAKGSLKTKTTTSYTFGNSVFANTSFIFSHLKGQPSSLDVSNGDSHWGINKDPEFSKDDYNSEFSLEGKLGLVNRINVGILPFGIGPLVSFAASIGGGPVSTIKISGSNDKLMQAGANPFYLDKEETSLNIDVGAGFSLLGKLIEKPEALSKSLPVAKLVQLPEIKIKPTQTSVANVVNVTSSAKTGFPYMAYANDFTWLWAPRTSMNLMNYSVENKLPQASFNWLEPKSAIDGIYVLGYHQPVPFGLPTELFQQYATSPSGVVLDGDWTVHYLKPEYNAAAIPTFGAGALSIPLLANDSCPSEYGPYNSTDGLVSFKYDEKKKQYSVKWKTISNDHYVWDTNTYAERFWFEPLDLDYWQTCGMNYTATAGRMQKTCLPVRRYYYLPAAPVPIGSTQSPCPYSDYAYLASDNVCRVDILPDLDGSPDGPGTFGCSLKTYDYPVDASAYSEKSIAKTTALAVDYDYLSNIFNISNYPGAPNFDQYKSQSAVTTDIEVLSSTSIKLIMKIRLANPETMVLTSEPVITLGYILEKI